MQQFWAHRFLSTDVRKGPIFPWHQMFYQCLFSLASARQLMQLAKIFKFDLELISKKSQIALIRGKIFAYQDADYQLQTKFH